LRSSSEFIALPKPASYPAGWLHASGVPNQDELEPALGRSRDL
jgi:hypothetical protein